MAPTPKPSRFPLYLQILLGMLVGIAAGVAARHLFDEKTVRWIVANATAPTGTLWMRLIFMTVVPLLFCAIAAGVAGLGDLAKLGRVGAKTLAFTVIVSGVAVGLGVALANFAKPGRGLSPEAQAKLQASYVKEGTKHVESAKAAKTVAETLVDLVPQNPLEEASFAFHPGLRGGGLLALMFFALIFGIALSRVPHEHSEPVLRLLGGVYAVLMKIIGGVMLLAPVGVAALLFTTAATLGTAFFLPLAKYVGVVIAGLAIHQFVVYAAAVRASGVGPVAFYRGAWPAMVTAFATASSNATLPTSLQVAQERLGIPREIANFVLSIGSTANQNGTALFEGVTVLFLAQFFGVELTLTQQIIVVLMSVLAGVGTAGVPGGSLPMIVIVLQSVGIPGEGIGIILGVDRILDMCRTTVNVTGDLTVATYVASSEGRLEAR